MVKLAQKFVPVLVDGDEDKSLAGEYDAQGYPHSIFTDPKGKLVAKVVGAVPTAEFLDEMKGALRKIGNVPLKKAAKELEEAAAALEKARGKGDWKATLKEAAKVLKINHEGAALDAARKAKEDAAAEGKKRLDAAKEQIGAGKAAEARGTLAKIASEFEGTDAAAEAKTLLKEMDAAAADAGGKDGGKEGK